MYKKPLNYVGSNDKWMYEHHRGDYDKYIGRTYGRTIDKGVGEAGSNTKWRRFRYKLMNKNRGVEWYNTREKKSFFHNEYPDLFSRFRWKRRDDAFEVPHDMELTKNDARHSIRKNFKRRMYDNYVSHVAGRSNFDDSLADSFSRLNILPKETQKMIRSFL